MEDRQHLWAQMQATQGAIVQHLAPKVREAIQNSIFKDVQGWFQLGLAYAIRPERLTVERIRVRNPYGNPDLFARHLQILRDVDLLDSDGVITQKAYNAYQHLIDVQEKTAQTLTLVSDERLMTLNNLLKKVIVDTVNSEDYPSVRDVSREGLHETPVHQLYDLISRFAAFRDDAHIVAWDHLELTAHQFEAMSLVWDGSATDAKTFTEIRPFRGYEESTWQATLDDLVDMGWLLKHDEAYSISDIAKEKRDAIEVKTDAIFLAPLETLTENDIQLMQDIMSEIQEKYALAPEAS